MCGIVSVVAPIAAPEREALATAMCGLLAHRGPDDQGLYSAGQSPLTLGHRRLSIIDLSPDGHQPMRRGRLHVAYNGEVYNYLELKDELTALGHRFVTRSDTEVLLAALQQWGEDGLSRVNGMFAILLFDEERRHLRLYRDRFGVKPLYYLFTPGRGIFLAGSEPKAVLHGARHLGVPVAADPDVLACFLADLPTETGEATFFTPLKRLPPGEVAELDLSSLPNEGGRLALRRRRWYALRPAAPASSHVQDGDERFLSLLTDAIRVRLRSDVPVGTCLSGGLDSSSIVCLASLRLGVRPHAFSAVYGAGDPADESRHIDAVAAHAGVPSHRIDPQDLFSPDALLAFLALHDEPVGGTTVWAQHCVFRLARQQGMTVMLDGQGADETLTGYHGAYRPLWAELLRRGALRSLRHELQAAGRLHGYRPLPALAGAGWILCKERLVPAALYRAYLERKWRGLFAPERTAGFRVHVPPFPQDPPHLREWQEQSPLHAYLYQLIYGSSLQTILRFEDRNSMAASIEARAPFLDYRLVEHCMAQPAHALVRDGYTKSLLRRALRGVLPESVRLRADKIGFATPETRWLKGPLRPVLEDLLFSPTMAGRGWFDIQALRRTFAALCADQSGKSGGTAASYTLFKAMNVELWLRHHRLG
jgi:asparagine synthase (glutamine-hydrolysing)